MAKSLSEEEKELESVFQPVQNKQQSQLIIYAEGYLIAGSLPALLFPLAAFATSFLNVVYYDSYTQCVSINMLVDPYYHDHLSHVMRSYSVWYYAYTLVYFFIIFKPFKALYRVSGIIMTIVMLIGYALCFLNINFLAKSKCKDTVYAKMSSANTLIFLIIGSFVFATAHILTFINKCRQSKCLKKGQEPGNKIGNINYNSKGKNDPIKNNKDYSIVQQDSTKQLNGNITQLDGLNISAIDGSDSKQNQEAAETVEIKKNDDMY